MTVSDRRKSREVTFVLKLGVLKNQDFEFKIGHLTKKAYFNEICVNVPTLKTTHSPCLLVNPK